MKKFLCISIVTTLLCTNLVGCSTKKATEAVNTSAVKYSNQYPLQTDKTLKLWTINPVHTEYKNYNDMPFYQEATKRTGVKLEIQGPTGGQFVESFNLLIASNNLPDMIMYDWSDKKVSGGPEKYISEGYILKLNDIINSYSPNLSNLLQQYPEIDKAIKTDSGSYYCYPNFAPAGSVSYAGPVVRKDWLDDLGLEVPQTIDDWHKMLIAFKEKKKATSPMLYTDWLLEVSGFISGAYGEIMDFYVENGKVKYGPINPGFKTFLSTFSSWYKEGLMDKDIATLDSKGFDARVLSGQTGAFLGTGGTIGKYIPSITANDPKTKFIGVAYPTLEKGQTPKFGQRDNDYRGMHTTVITTAAKDVELAARFLDYFYTNEGSRFANFGVENATYTMEGDYPKLTDQVLKAKDIHTEVSKYACQDFSYFDNRYYEQRMYYPEQKEAISTWSKTDKRKYTMPALLPSEADAARIAKIMSEVNTYVKESYIKFLIGSKSIDEFDSYVSKTKDLGIDDVLNIYQSAYEKYLNR